MSNVAVDEDGAVVVHGAGLAHPPVSAAASTQASSVTTASAAPSTAESQAAPTSAAPTSAANEASQADAAASDAVPAPSPPVPSTAAENVGEPAASASTQAAAGAAVEATTAPPAPAQPTNPPANEATQPPPAAPAPPPPSQAVVEPEPAASEDRPSPVDDPAVQASAINGANVFAPGVEDEQEPLPTESSSPNPATSAITSATQAAPVASSTTAAAMTTSSATTSRSSTATSRASGSTSSAESDTTEVESATTSETSTSVTQNEVPTSTTEIVSESEAIQSTQDPAANQESSAAEETAAPGDTAIPETTFVSGTVTFTGAAALAAESAAGKAENKDKKDGLSSFAIIGIVGGNLVFFILIYITWFQWRKRRARRSLEQVDDIGYSPTSTAYDPYGLANEKHSGFDFLDQPLSARPSQHSRKHAAAAAVTTENPFANPENPFADAQDPDYQRRLETQYTESWYTDAGEAGLGTARSHKWHDEGKLEVLTGQREHLDDGQDTADGRRPSYIDGPQSIYHESHDPDNPNAHMWTEMSPSTRSAASPKTAPTTPPVPPVPAAYQKRDTRPQTDFSYGDFYTGYNSTRPSTQYTTQEIPPQTATNSIMQTPATSMLLPWLNKGDAPPPVPVKGPVDPKSLPNRKDTGAHGYGFGSPPTMPLRAPPAAAMAKEPAVKKSGWLGAIPTFR